mmetsp:Transcript_72551/g.125908  ORF Transcript_72551/g.125908 Transcript_72551/m.125908 type:complete len:125 (-) Transcript_72551:253-627(-)
MGRAREAPPPRPPGGGIRRTRPGANVAREIKKFQNDMHFVSFSKISFARLVRETQNQYLPAGQAPYRWSVEGLVTLQKVCEEYLTFLFADAYVATYHRRRVTLNIEDLRLVRRLRGPTCFAETM